MKMTFETEDIDEAMRIMEAFKSKPAPKPDGKIVSFPTSFGKVSWKVKRKTGKPHSVRLKGHRIPYKELLGQEIKTFVEQRAGLPRTTIMEKVLAKMLPYKPGKEAKRRIWNNIAVSMIRLRKKRAKPINPLSETRPEPDREFKESVMKDVGSHWKTGVKKEVILNRIMAILKVNEEVATNQYLLLRREGVLMESPEGRVKKVFTHVKRKKRNALIERTLETAAEA